MSNDHKALNWLINTAAGFAADNPVLPPNYRAFISDTGAEVQGDGSSAFSALVQNAVQPGRVISKLVTFTENATNTIHTGTVPIPAGAWLHDIQITNKALWTATSASMDVGDTADPNGFFDTIDLKATDLAVGEVLSMRQGSIDTDGLWGGQQGAYLVAATGRRGPVTSNFGMYYEAGSNIIGVITVGTPATTVGRTIMCVTYSIGDVIAAVATGP